MPRLKDRVKESTTTTGTGNISLAGAATGFQTFNSAFGIGVSFSYSVSSAGGAEWEVGYGHLSQTDTLVRDTILASSNSGAAVAFSAGTKDVFATFPAIAGGASNIGRSWALARGYAML